MSNKVTKPLLLDLVFSEEAWEKRLNLLLSKVEEGSYTQEEALEEVMSFIRKEGVFTINGKSVPY